VSVRGWFNTNASAADPFVLDLDSEEIGLRSFNVSVP
jgi:hypothetical protein